MGALADNAIVAFALSIVAIFVPMTQLAEQRSRHRGHDGLRHHAGDTLSLYTVQLVTGN